MLLSLLDLRLLAGLSWVFSLQSPQPSLAFVSVACLEHVLLLMLGSELEVVTPEPPSQNVSLALVHLLVNCAPRLQGLQLPSLLLGVSTSDKSLPLNAMSL